MVLGVIFRWVWESDLSRLLQLSCLCVMVFKLLWKTCCFFNKEEDSRAVGVVKEDDARGVGRLVRWRSFRTREVEEEGVKGGGVS